jgi:hypothetical protein
MEIPNPTEISNNVLSEGFQVPFSIPIQVISDRPQRSIASRCVSFNDLRHKFRFLPMVRLYSSIPTISSHTPTSCSNYPAGARAIQSSGHLSYLLDWQLQFPVPRAEKDRVQASCGTSGKNRFH